jgi:succinate dehydrogenase / fumarate reductase iron-sulfur subunit
MPDKKVTFRILRFKPDHIDPPHYQDFTLNVGSHMTVLDCLEKIRLEQDNTLMYRHSCHHASCGTCACKINGQEKLACTTNAHALEEDVITVAPLDGYAQKGDLAVSRQQLFKDFSKDWTHLKDSPETPSTDTPEGIQRFTRFENCIECGACTSACPLTHTDAKFLGPAVLSAAHIEVEKNPAKEKKLLSLAGSERGVHHCERALNCSRVCPTGVYPARHMADLKRRLKIK